MEIPKDLFVVPDIDNSTALVSFTWPENAKCANWKILDACGKTVFSGNLRATGGEKIQMTVKIPDAKPWSINSPYLYNYELKFDESPATFTNFGMRKIGVCGRDIMVNNQKFCARGYIRGREAHDHPNLLNLPLREYYEKNIRMAKDYGFNLIRFHSTIPPKECFDAADSLGIFMHIEIRKYFGRYQAKERAKMKEDGEIIDLNEWTEDMLAIRNHSSLMFYCIGNEIRHPGCNPFISQVAKITRELDPTRLFIDTCAHGEFDRTYVDFDVQHMSYFYPFGENYDMLERTYNWLIYGSCKGQQLHDSDREDNPTYKITRGINSARPTLAHEICHYAAYRETMTSVLNRQALDVEQSNDD